MKFLTGPATSVSYPFQQSLVGLEPHNYKEGEPEWMAKDDVVDFTDVGNWPKMDHIMDYFNSLSDREREKIVKKPYLQVDKEVEQWDKDLAAQERSSESKLKEGTDYEVLYKDGDYTWVKLTTKAAYECEGEGMGHCVGGYDPDNPSNTILSLWDKKGEPHVTIEIQKYDSAPYDVEGNPLPVRTDDGGAEDLEEIIQIKGKQNDAPVGKYKELTARFVKNWVQGGTFNERAKSIKELEPSRIVRDDGKGIGMIRHEGAGGEWHYYFEDTKIWKMIYKLSILPMQRDRIEWIRKSIGEDETYGLIIDGDANLSYGYFEEIPKEFANVRGVTDGDFNVQHNLLTSLKNSPEDIDGDFYAAHNQLETLEGGPDGVDGDFKVDNNNLKNLKGLPEYIAGDLHINANPLESLEGAENTAVYGTVFVGGWSLDEMPLISITGDWETSAPDFMKRDKIIAAFKKIGKRRPTGKVHPGSWRETEGEVQFVSQGVRAYPEPPHPDRRYTGASEQEHQGIVLR